MHKMLSGAVEYNVNRLHTRSRKDELSLMSDRSAFRARGLAMEKAYTGI